MAALKADVAELKGDVAELKGDVRDLAHAIENQGNALRAEFQRDLRVQLAGMIGGSAALFTLIATAFRLI